MVYAHSNRLVLAHDLDVMLVTGPGHGAQANLAGVIAANPCTFRIFSPDELESNKFGGVFKAPTSRDYQWPVEGGGRTEHVGRQGGRVLEVPGEHTCQAWLTMDEAVAHCRAGRPSGRGRARTRAWTRTWCSWASATW